MRLVGIWYGVALGLMAMSLIGGGALVTGSRADERLLASLFGTCVGLCWFLDGAALALRGWRGDRLTEQERRARAEQVETINYERYLRNLERERRLEGPQRPAETSGSHAADWRVAAHRFLVWGDREGFTVRALAAENDVVSWDDWSLMREFLVEAGILAGTGTGTRWNTEAGWSLERWEQERHTTKLPHRPTPAPEVAIPVLTTTPQRPTTAFSAVGE